MGDIIEFPDKKDELNKYRMEQILTSLNDKNTEFFEIDLILCAIYNFLTTLEESEMVLHDITKLRASIEEFYADE